MTTRNHRAQQLRFKGPLRKVVRDVIGSDGLVYQQLECTHRLLLMPSDYCLGTEMRRHCWLCGALAEPKREATAQVG
jgi:hypothetical protein